MEIDSSMDSRIDHAEHKETEGQHKPRAGLPLTLPLALPVALKHDPELGPGQCLHIPSHFVRSGHLSPPAKVLYLILCAYAAAGRDTLPSGDQIAEECGGGIRQSRVYSFSEAGGRSPLE